jgi:hypothetical protein
VPPPITVPVETGATVLDIMIAAADANSDYDFILVTVDSSSMQLMVQLMYLHATGSCSTKFPDFQKPCYRLESPMLLFAAVNLLSFSATSMIKQFDTAATKWL